MKKPRMFTPYKPKEIEIQTASLCLLHIHPLVAWAARFNSGGAPMIGKGGKRRPVKFNTLDGCPDIMGQLKTGIHLAIEMKRPPWSKPKDKHEEDQLDHLNRVYQNGGLAFFATSVEQIATRLSLFKQGIVHPPLWGLAKESYTAPLPITPPLSDGNGKAGCV